MCHWRQTRSIWDTSAALNMVAEYLIQPASAAMNTRSITRAAHVLQSLTLRGPSIARASYFGGNMSNRLLHKRPPPDETEKQRIRFYFGWGKTVKELARDFNHSQSTIRKILREK
jgi:hypothetical protein